MGRQSSPPSSAGDRGMILGIRSVRGVGVGRSDLVWPPKEDEEASVEEGDESEDDAPGVASDHCST